MVDDAQVPAVSARLSLVRLFLELVLYKEALSVLTGIIMTDDQEVEAWYLEGWCFMLMAEDAKEKGIKVEDLSWDELARDARDCLETCKHVNPHPSPSINLDSYFLAASRKSKSSRYRTATTRSRVNITIDGTRYRVSG